MSEVVTADGYIDRKKLEIRDVVKESDTARVVATEFYHEGRLVRRDVWVNVLRGADMPVQGGLQ